MWRIVASPNFNASPEEILTRWTIDDVAAAHEMLDILDDLEILKANQQG